MRAAVIGTGVAGGWAAAAIEQIDGLELIAAVDSDLGEVRPLRGNVELVVISTGTPSHAEIARRVLAELEPRRLWIEKPRVIEPADLTDPRLWQPHIRTLLHRAYAPEIAEARAELPHWRDEHGPIREIEATFVDPYEPTEARLRSLGDCWADSGINALSAIGALVGAPGEITDATGSLPREARVSFTFEDAGRPGTATIHAAWEEGGPVKRTVLRFQDGAEMRIEHQAADLGPVRYRRMFESYLASDTPPAPDRRLHELLVAARERIRNS